MNAHSACPTCRTELSGERALTRIYASANVFAQGASVGAPVAPLPIIIDEDDYEEDDEEDDDIYNAENEEIIENLELENMELAATNYRLRQELEDAIDQLRHIGTEVVRYRSTEVGLRQQLEAARNELSQVTVAKDSTISSLRKELAVCKENLKDAESQNTRLKAIRDVRDLDERMNSSEERHVVEQLVKAHPLPDCKESKAVVTLLWTLGERHLQMSKCVQSLFNHGDSWS